MTVNTVTNSVSAVGDGVTNAFTLNFQFYVKADLVVTFDDIQQSSGIYSTTGGGGSTGAIIFSVPPANGVAVKISRILPLVQQAQFTRNDPFPAKTHEIALDRIVMMLQQIEGGSGGGGGDVSPEFIQDTVSVMFGGSHNGISVVYDDVNGTITLTNTDPGIADAPSDSVYYVRRNGAWLQMDWANIANKPSTFPPDAHTHSSSAITDLTETTQDLVAPMFAHAGHTNISFTYDDASGIITAVAQAGAMPSGTAPYTWDDTSTAMADPGSGKIRGNGTTMQSHSQLAISNTDNGGDLPNIAALVVGDTLIISNNSAATPGKYLITAITPNASWTLFAVTADSSYSTGNPGNGDSMNVGGVVTSGGGGSGIPEAPNDGIVRGRGSLTWAQVPWNDVTGKPSSFPPSAHTHVVADITDFPTDHVVGPASSVDGRIPVFNGSTGKLLKQSGASVDGNGKIFGATAAAATASFNAPPGTAPSAPVNGDMWTTAADFFVRINAVSVTFARTSHTHAQSDVTNLTTDLAAKETLGEYSAINAQTGTTYTFVLTDKGKLVTANNASAQIYTVPPNSSQAIPVKGKIDLAALGVGQVTIAPGASVVLRSAGGKLKLTGQYSAATLVKIATDEWLVFGDLSA